MLRILFLLTLAAVPAALILQGSDPAAIHFSLRPIDFQLENDQTRACNAPETMPGGVAIFDYNGDGKPDLFFTNGADISTLKKIDRKYRNRLFRNDGNFHFTDVTDQARVAGTGYDIGAAVGDYDNDGHPDLFVAGVGANTLFHNNGDGTFSDVTAAAGLGDSEDKQFGRLWGVTAAWVDVNRDGLLDLFVVNYLQWKYSPKPLCGADGKADYCHPKFYEGQPNQLFLNRGKGHFEDVSVQWGIRGHVGKGMGVGVADMDNDGLPDLFVPNDAYYNSLFHNLGNKFEEVAMNSGVALPEDGNFISGMGTEFRDVNNNGLPDISFVALNNQTFPLFTNLGKGEFREVTGESGLRTATYRMSGFGIGMFDFDNDGWKDLFVSRGHVESIGMPGQDVDQLNTVFRNGGTAGKWTALTAEAGLSAGPARRHRGCAFADLDGDGRIDAVVTALASPAEIWQNDTPSAGHWLAIALEGTRSNRDAVAAQITVTTRAGVQYNHVTSSTGYASSSYGPVWFGLGAEREVQRIDIKWPSGAVQSLSGLTGDQVLKVREPDSSARP